MKLHPIGIRAVFAVAGLTVLAVADVAVAQITVTSLADSGPGTLRTAISQATSGSGNVTILFDPSLAGGTIHVLSALGNLNKEGITIQGDIDGDGIPDIELDGSSAPTNVNGLTIQQANCLISGLIVNRFGANGIRITGATAQNNTVHNCYIGTDRTGATALPNQAGGILINATASNNVIGPSNVVSGNSGNSADGLQINAASGNTVKGNLIGTDLAGVTAIPNQAFGINIANGSSANVIGGALAADRNVISGNTSAGIRVNGAATSENLIVGNYCGVDMAGLNTVPNNIGILLNNGTNLNIIGPNNVLAGNTLDGIQLNNANDNTIKGNLIGTDSTGVVAVPNQRHGINLTANASGNTIGGSGASDGNVVSGNQRTGIQINGSGSTTNSVIGNLCGTNRSGMAPLPNVEQGIIVNDGASQNAIGPRNILSGNQQNGIRITGSTTSSNSVLGNLIGTNQVGTSAIPNGEQGISVDFGSSHNVIGPDNVASGNQGSGIRISGSGTSSNTVLGNLIGTNQSGINAIPNEEHGILVDFGASQNTIGPFNAIRSNAKNGILLKDTATAQNLITQNSIWQNIEEGIALLHSAQGGIPSPVLESVTVALVSGFAASADGSVVEIFNDAEDEGETFLGSAIVNSGQFSYTGPVPIDRRITATVTDPSNNTSGFSTPFLVGNPEVPAQAPPCDGDYLVASRRHGSVYAINPSTGLIRGLVTGLELRDLSGLVRGSGPFVSTGVSIPVAWDIRLLSDADGTILARFGLGSASYGIISIDRSTGNRSIRPSTNEQEWDEVGEFFYLDSQTIIGTADHWNTGTTGAILRHDLLTNVTTIVSAPTIGDGPLPLLPRPVALLDSDTLVVAEVGLTGHTTPRTWQDVGVYLVDIPSGNRSFLSRLTFYRGFARSLIVGGSPAGTILLGDDEGGSGPVMNQQCRSVAVVAGRIFVSTTIEAPPKSGTFNGGIMEIDRKTGNRTLLVGQAFVDDGQQSKIVEVLPPGTDSLNLDAPISIQDDGSGNLLFTHLFGTDGLYPIHRYNLTSGVLEQLAEISSQVLPEYSDLQLSGLAVYHGPSLNINEQPADLTICAGSDAHLSVVACGNPSPTFQWHFNDVPLSDNGHVLGATTPALTILSATVSDAGTYDCLISNGSGEVTSIDAALTVLTGGTGDGNGDSRDDGLDIQGLTNALVVGGPPSPGYCAYDMNGDGIVNMADVNPFVQLLLAS
jgi:hypothetical protein